MSDIYCIIRRTTHLMILYAFITMTESVIRITRERRASDTLSHPLTVTKDTEHTAFLRESALMITAMNYVMAKSDFVKQYQSNDGVVQVSEYDSKKWGKKFITLHSTGNDRAVTLKLGADKITYYDEWGNEQEIYGKDGLFTFRAKSAPTYILGDIKDVEFTEDDALIGYDSLKTECAVNNSTTVPITNYTDKDYTIEAIVPSCGEVAGVTDLKAGQNGTVTIKNSAPVGTEYIMTLNVKDGDKTVQSLDYNIKSDMPVKVDFECTLAPGVII